MDEQNEQQHISKKQKMYEMSEGEKEEAFQQQLNRVEDYEKRVENDRELSRQLDKLESRQKKLKKKEQKLEQKKEKLEQERKKGWVYYQQKENQFNLWTVSITRDGKQYNSYGLFSSLKLADEFKTLILNSATTPFSSIEITTPIHELMLSKNIAIQSDARLVNSVFGFDDIDNQSVYELKHAYFCLLFMN